MSELGVGASDRSTWRPSVASVVIQATSFCNINCSYCYLSERSRRTKLFLSPVVLRGFLSKFVTEENKEGNVEFIFHSGEPLTCGLERMSEYTRTIKEHCAAIGIRPIFVVQTNGLLMTSKWANFFRLWDFDVGISFDILKSAHDSKRLTHLGKGTYDRVSNAIRLCQQSGLSPSIICVITPELVSDVESTFAILSDHGVERVAFNLDEITGANLTSHASNNVAAGLFERFLVGLWTLARERHVQLDIREISTALDKLRQGGGTPWRASVPLRYMTLLCDGGISTFSPEMAAQSAPEGPSPFRFGHCSVDNFGTLRASPALIETTASIQAGLEQCKTHCDYFGVCGGGNPANKVFEHGTFASSETAFCRTLVKGSIDAASKILVEQLTLADKGV